MEITRTYCALCAAPAKDLERVGLAPGAKVGGICDSCSRKIQAYVESLRDRAALRALGVDVEPMPAASTPHPLDVPTEPSEAPAATVPGSCDDCARAGTCGARKAIENTVQDWEHILPSDRTDGIFRGVASVCISAFKVPK